MDMDTVFSILFVIVIILFQGVGLVLKKIKSRRQKTAGKTSAGRSGGVLQSLFTRIQEEIEQARQAAQSPSPGSSTGWEQLLGTPSPASQSPAGASEPDTLPAERPGREETGASARSESASPRVTLSAEEAGLEELELDTDVLTEKPAPLPPKDPVAASSPTLPSAGFLPGKKDLRRAVIWSEILAPPLALRKEE